MHKVSVREISRATGFSPATVSNALNHKRNVSEETAEKIRAAAKAMGYQHPSQLDAITFVLARKTGAIVDESTFHPSVIEGVERQARRHGMGTAFVSLDFSDLDAVRPQVAALVSDPSAAIVLLGTELGEEDYALFRDTAARLVVLDGWSDRFDFDAVVMANEGSALRAVRYLTERGHKRIGYLSGDFRIQNFRARERGFFRALDEAGLGFDPLWRIELGTTLERAYEDMKAKLANIHQADLPTAFFADNDVLAVGALRALAEAGVRVPEDVSIIGFDDLSIGAFSTPPLSTVHVLKHEVGEIAVRRLVGNVNNPKNYTCKTLVSTYFVERKSVCEH
ncbi:LacI family DNA-binding transcriptional regulator [Collinsella sp. An307]|uniref:LacI family DNA-binding transcriptional regulator n=1 Tax=Collinsella sp. An307 TaxID=1965630 RepID=UPI000B3887F0|nr:LacI family DNA-binding transcriptional regulator [Collinsella sp. An307]OUO20878.1 LacI family transcriptional regulator [Collinsella sp. An307]